MALSRELRLLQNKWNGGQGFPKRLEWLQIDGLRGWTNQRINFDFPLIAIVGENGVGKSTVLQAIAASYQNTGDQKFFASDFFPDTSWELVTGVTIRVSVREGAQNNSLQTSVRKPTNRWRGNPERRARSVVYIDLRRIQPIAARYGYGRLANPQLTEGQTNLFDPQALHRLSNVMGRHYELAKLSTTTFDETRYIPVLQKDGNPFSGFHQGAGEVAMTELLKTEIPPYSIVLIDEIETSFHPRVQRRLIRELATLARTLELQIIFSTHSPYILEELPPTARNYIMDSAGGKKIISGVSPEFAMTKMDEEQHPEADIYVEDERSAAMLREIVIQQERELVLRLQFIPYGAANVGRALGMMVNQGRFPTPSVVFLDGDQEASEGCYLLPGNDAPERVVFDGLRLHNWAGIAQRVGRDNVDVIDACNLAMAAASHKEWIKMAADRLFLGSDVLWQALCAEWAARCSNEAERQAIVDVIVLALTPVV